MLNDVPNFYLIFRVSMGEILNRIEYSYTSSNQMDSKFGLLV